MKQKNILRRYRWHLAVIYAALILVVLLALLTTIFETADSGNVPEFVWMLGGVIVLGTALFGLKSLLDLTRAVNETNAQLEKISQGVEKNRSVLEKIGQSTRLSERAKSIAYRDLDRQSLREVVFDKLQQQDFETTYGIIEEISNLAGYKDLAQQLRAQADRYRTATRQERINQVISHIDKLLEEQQWAKASKQIEQLIKSQPDSEKAKAAHQKLLEKKQERKRILLNAWDGAVKRQATDRSLEILRELDMYLSPNEALALQEAARDVFRNKLHNLGVQFSLAIAEKEWHKALQTAQQIMRDFPNSRMAQEIRQRRDALKQKALGTPNQTSAAQSTAS